MENIYVNQTTGAKYATNLKHGGKVYKRNISQKHFVYKHNGFGIQATLLSDLIERGYESVEFNVKDVVYGGVDGRGNLRVACERGKYTITLENLARLGRLDTLRSSDGEQVFIDKDYCSFVGG